MNTGTRVAVVVLASFLAACGKDEPPAANTPATTTPPTTTPVTLPTPQPPPGAASCGRIGPGQSQQRCAKEEPTFDAEIETAIDELFAERGDLFTAVSGGHRVNSTGQFLVSMIEKLDRKGLCAGFDGEELQVKNNNAFNDQYHMITSGMLLRRGRSKYQATCYPATFPTPHPGYPPSNGCALPSSLEITCGREDSLYYPDIERGLDKVIREHPEVFDLNNTQRGTNWPKIVQADRFVVLIIQAMQSFGYCSRHDGEELVVKKENKVSEHFDIETAEGYVRRGAGIYGASCYPAAF